MYKSFWLLLLLGTVAKTGAQEKAAVLFLELIPRAGRQLLQQGVPVRNDFGEELMVRNFNYYISHLQVADSSGLFRGLGDSCFLVQQAVALSRQLRLELPFPRNRLRQLRFMLGVDSAVSREGVLTGTLDPAQGMFWTWNSGYITAKLEGTSMVSRAPGHYFTYHIGGYRSGQNAARWVTLAVQAPVGDTLRITADALRWFNGKNTIRIAEHPVCHEPGPLAMLLADNYAGMFSIEEP